MVFFKQKKEKTEQAATPEKSPVLPSLGSSGEALKKTGNFKKTGTASVIRNSRLTEKSSLMAGANKYVFVVSPKANKNQIKKDLKAKFGVEAVSVNIVNLPTKERRRGAIVGHKPGLKKAIVTIKEGQKIEIS